MQFGIGASTQNFVEMLGITLFVADYTNGTAANRFKGMLMVLKLKCHLVMMWNADGQWNGNGKYDIGIIGSSTTPFDGYMAEINVISQVYDLHALRNRFSNRSMES